MSDFESKRHHWWPECISKHWEDQEGCTHWILPDGEIKRAPAKNFGVIGHAHNIKPDKEGQPSVWDHSFEPIFQQADNNFPPVIEWLGALDREYIPLREAPRDGFRAQTVSDESLRQLVECLVSLVVRSPKFRETAVAPAEYYRGSLPARERNALIGMNMMHCQRRISDSIGTSGKFAVLYALEREFVFGDGFYHNLSSATQSGFGTRIVVPLTPYITVFYASPMHYRTDPKLVTLILDDEEVEFLNRTVQTYAKQCLFYKSEVPDLIEEYRQNKHLVYAAPDPISNWVQDLSGVPAEPKRLHY